MKKQIFNNLELASSTKIFEYPDLDACGLAEICKELKADAKNIVVIEDDRTFDIRDKIVQDLSSYYNLTIQNKVFPNPKSSDISDMFDSITQCDLVIGIGGGSTMDSAKALAMLLANAQHGTNLDSYLGSDAQNKIEKKSLPLILIPTTAGTGSEVTRVGVYTSKSGRKFTLGSNLMQADVAILCSLFSSKMPASLASSTGFDALSHALESIWNKNATEQTISLATEAANEILNNIEIAYCDAKKSTNTNSASLAQNAMLRASCLAGLAFSITGTASVHAISFVLSEEWHVPHGSACAFTLEDVFAINTKDKEIEKRFSKLIKLQFGDNGNIKMLLEKIVQLKKNLLLPFKFCDLGVKISKDNIETLFMRSFDDPKMHNNFPAIKPETVFDMLKNKI